ncbi:hypothetical protein XELAEV_18004639mg [Xenopus laevis]|uniref:G-protein coupled receptors family 3 profile domain-containing protein n=1 Tax=Xenopus laevis TaxID=8355 RepID=A0A974BQU1_XENLA|nr:hypothetical protein XELAEV_18004639mg [Xenopus laevis]
MLGVCNIFNVIGILLHVTVLCVGLSRIQSINPACHLEAIKSYKELEYVKEGDIMIGGVMTVHSNVYDLNTRSPFDTRDMSDRLVKFICFSHSEEHLKHLLDFRYVIEQINNSTTQLPNQTLGYYLHDSCGDTRKAVRSVFQILSGTTEPIPNYSCIGDRNIAGFIGDLSSKTTVPIAQILSLYGYSQISYGATDPSLSDRITFPYFFRTVQSDETNYFTLVQLIKYFGWTWVGFITSDDITGFYEHQIFSQYLSSQGICLEYTIYLNQNVVKADDKVRVSHEREKMELSTSSVVIVGGTVSFLTLALLDNLNKALAIKNIIFLPQWGTYLLRHLDSFKHFNNSLILYSLYPYNLDTPEINQYYENVHPSNNPEDKMLEDIWMLIFSCLSRDQNKKDYYEAFHGTSLHNCTGGEYFTNHVIFKYFGGSSRMHLPVSIMTRAIVKMHTEIRNESPERHVRPIIYRHQLHHYLKEMTVYITDGQPSKFDKNGNLEMDYGIFNNIIKFLNDGLKGTLGPIGKIRVRAPADQQIEIKENLITWNTVSSVTKAIESCRRKEGQGDWLGKSKPERRLHPELSYLEACRSYCITIPRNSEKCLRCQDLEWPNEKRTRCIAKVEEFLSYTNDVISLFVSTLSIFIFFITLLILGVFISYRDTPIVKANNKNLSFLLLVSIKLSFLSVFLFLGRPVDITCMLRNITFGITFSIAVSSLLAKTIMVCVAFKATKPGSSWRKWVGVKLSYSVVLFCSSIQIIICMTWLVISPPFQEQDLHTYPGTIIIQCNEGSAIGFYSVIGYMGLLAAVSFVLAFLARTLPDSFNEAKYITFSMLLFCSVWITMIPAYLSTKGKNTVCVEIFAILTSSAGLLACIFLPKCYTILRWAISIRRKIREIRKTAKNSRNGAGVSFFEKKIDAGEFFRRIFAGVSRIYSPAANRANSQRIRAWRINSPITRDVADCSPANIGCSRPPQVRERRATFASKSFDHSTIRSLKSKDFRSNRTIEAIGLNEIIRSNGFDRSIRTKIIRSND